MKTSHPSLPPAAAAAAVAAITSSADTRDLAAFLARVLEAAILGASLHDAVAANLHHLEQASGYNPNPNPTPAPPRAGEEGAGARGTGWAVAATSWRPQLPDSLPVV